MRYEKPSMEIIFLESEDIVTVSLSGPGDGGSGNWGESKSDKSFDGNF